MSISTSGSNEELSEEDQKTLEQELINEAEWSTAEPENILVRGALLYCDCGTHKRRLNLPKSYGSYTDAELKHPFVTEKDCIVGDKNNISYFGVCKSENCGKQNEEQICLRPYEQTDSVENVIGPKCTPVIMGKWLNPAEESYVTDMTTDKKEQYLKLKTSSILVCKYGGVIRIEESGQSYEEDITDGGNNS